MPSLKITFSEAELEEIRGAASDTSVENYVHDSALTSARTRKALVARMARQVATTSAVLNARLA